MIGNINVENINRLNRDLRNNERVLSWVGGQTVEQLNRVQFESSNEFVHTSDERAELS